MSEKNSENAKIVDCPACNGSGKIDMTIHVVRPGKSVALCGQPRPTSDRRRTTNPMMSDCKGCLDVVKQEEIQHAVEKDRR